MKKLFLISAILFTTSLYANNKTTIMKVEQSKVDQIIQEYIQKNVQPVETFDLKIKVYDISGNLLFKEYESKLNKEQKSILKNSYRINQYGGADYFLRLDRDNLNLFQTKQ